MKTVALVVLGLALLQTATVDAGLYVRWGRTTCAVGSTALYTGYMVKEYYSAPGGGHNFLCLSDSPQWGNVVNNGQPKTWFTGLHGVQYWFGPGYSNNNPFSYANYNNQDIYQHTAPCVACLSSRVNALMIPGVMTCPELMVTEYSGYIVADHWQNQASEYICLDQAPEVAKAGGFNSGEGLLIIGQIICGALPCPNPFVQYNQVSCAMCTV